MKLLKIMKWGGINRVGFRIAGKQELAPPAGCHACIPNYWRGKLLLARMYATSSRAVSELP